ncbi:uncharacterized protein TNCV_3248751 [Trichonephila clavipes]|nr:uncharacterized protein TNCV_3248751 [Trichonephila clavipes]
MADTTSMVMLLQCTYIHFICYKESPNNARSVAFSQRACSPRLIDDETLNDCGIMNNLIDCVDGQELDFLRAEKIYEGGYSFPTNWESIFLNSNSKRSVKFQKELRSCISGYRDIYKQLTNRPSSQKLISYLMVPKNKSFEVVFSSDESDFELIYHKKMSALDYVE